MSKSINMMGTSWKTRYYNDCVLDLAGVDLWIENYTFFFSVMPQLETLTYIFQYATFLTNFQEPIVTVQIYID